MTRLKTFPAYENSGSEKIEQQVDSSGEYTKLILDRICKTYKIEGNDAVLLSNQLNYAKFLYGIRRGNSLWKLNNKQIKRKLARCGDLAKKLKKELEHPQVVRECLTTYRELHEEAMTGRRKIPDFRGRS